MPHPNRTLQTILAFILILPGATYLTAKANDRPQIAAGLQLEDAIEYRNLRAFTWDEHGTTWILSENGNRLILGVAPTNRPVEPQGSFQRLGNEVPGLLVHRNRAFVSDGNMIRRFRISAGSRLEEDTPYILPSNLFPRDAQITSLLWSPLGPIHFRYQSALAQERGLGSWEIRNDRSDLLAKGVTGDISFDINGFPVGVDDLSADVFRLGWGLDYERGLHNYTKKDLALPLDHPGIKATAIAIHPGDRWPEENRETWLLFDAATSALQQLREEKGRLKRWRNLLQWSRPVIAHDLQFGPDGALWILLESEGAPARSIVRLRPAEHSSPPPADLAALKNENLILLLTDDMSWRRDTALRVLDDKSDLRQTRGLHPSTGLHDLVNNEKASALARRYALLSLHRLELLDETLLENISDAPDAALRIWAGLLFGERNYPTGVAFQQLMKLAKAPEIEVRMAAAVAARQFVSGSLGVDTAPRAMPIREVFTGGILSTLWFSTEKSRSPAFDLLFWGAVRPISAYDSAHPMGFFNGDREEGLPIAYWIVGLITEQIAEQDDPLKQEDAMRMVGELKPGNARMIIAALQGLQRATPRRLVAATEKSLNVLETFSRSENFEIAALGKELLEAWRRAPRK